MSQQRIERRLIRRFPANVGDYISYRFGSGVTTRRVIEVIDGGRKFVVEGFYNVNATQITAHIPMHVETEENDDEDTFEWCGVGKPVRVLVYVAMFLMASLFWFSFFWLGTGRGM